jgi:accessory gene regulator protein AgrB
MSETKCALYLGAIFSTLFRLVSYIFLRVVCIGSSSFSSPVLF